MNKKDFHNKFEIIDEVYFEASFPGKDLYFMRCLKCQDFVPTWQKNHPILCSCGNIHSTEESLCLAATDEHMVHLILAADRANTTYCERGSLYLRCLLAMEHLLVKVGERDWIGWVRRNIDDWNNDQSVPYYCSAYRGRGSINDLLYLCSEGGHSVDRMTGRWANALLDLLCSLCNILTESKAKDFSIRQFRGEMRLGYLLGPLSSGPTRLVDDQRELSHITNEIYATRCDQCGCTVFSREAIDTFIAENLLPEKMIHALMDDTLLTFIDAVFNCEIEDLQMYRAKVEKILLNRGHIINDNEYTGVCLACNTEGLCTHQEPMTFPG